MGYTVGYGVWGMRFRVRGMGYGVWAIAYGV